MDRECSHRTCSPSRHGKPDRKSGGRSMVSTLYPTLFPSHPLPHVGGLPHWESHSLALLIGVLALRGPGRKATFPLSAEFRFSPNKRSFLHDSMQTMKPTSPSSAKVYEDSPCRTPQQ